MIVDSFTAVGGCQNRPIKLGIDQFRRAMDKNGVDLAMTFSLRSVQVDAVLGNEYLYSIAKKDARILPVAVVDPRSSQHLDRTLDSAVTNEAVALAFHMTGISCPPNSILFRRSLKAAAATSKSLIFVDNIAGRLTQLAEMTRDLGCRKVLFAGASYHRADELLAILRNSTTFMWRTAGRSHRALSACWPRVIGQIGSCLVQWHRLARCVWR